MNTKYWCFQEISFGVFAPNTSKSNIRVSEPLGSNRFSEPTPTPSTALTLLLLGTGGLLRRLLDFKIPLIVSVKWRENHHIYWMIMKAPSSSTFPPCSSSPDFKISRFSESDDFRCSSRTFGRSLLFVNFKPPLQTCCHDVNTKHSGPASWS